MKTRDSIPAFFWHYLSEDAIRLGWDMESDMFPSLESIKDEVAFTLKGSGVTVTYADLIEVAQGNMTGETFKAFVTGVYDLVKDQEPHESVIVSMHSGSSDYFTVEMVKDFVENA